MPPGLRLREGVKHERSPDVWGVQPIGKAPRVAMFAYHCEEDGFRVVASWVHRMMLPFLSSPGAISGFAAVL